MISLQSLNSLVTTSCASTHPQRAPGKGIGGMHVPGPGWRVPESQCHSLGTGTVGRHRDGALLLSVPSFSAVAG